MSPAPIVGGMGFLSLLQLTVAANWSGGSVLFLWTLYVQVPTATPHAMGRLPTISPDVAKLLAVVTLRKATVPCMPQPGWKCGKGFAAGKFPSILLSVVG
jgi:hypothetical protein